LTIFRFDTAFDIAWDVKPALKRIAYGTAPDVGQREKQVEYRKKVKSKRQEFRQIKKERHAEKEHAKRLEHRKRKKRAQQELFELERELRAAAEREEEDTPNRRTTPRAEGEPDTGVLPDFVVIGTKKGGTSFLYHLLTLHPHVEPAANKELHYFDVLFRDEDIEWYRRCFPAPRWKDGRRTITGEATPGYLCHPTAPERMAEMVPQAKLIALLRNPVDRAYSDYQQGVRKGREPLTFEEAIEAEETQTAVRRRYLAKGIYVDYFLRWLNHFSDEQILLLKSEDLFERPTGTLKPVLNFLDLPKWEPETSAFIPKKRNEGHYEREMDPATRRRLERYFEPHNQRLYEYLDVDFGW
jgi:hypothetical protein